MLSLNWLCLAAAIAATQMVNLLLPGFQGRSLEASIKEKNLNVTAYIVICPKTIRASDCGVSGNGITTISAPAFVEIQVDSFNDTASLYFQIIGTTYASHQARQTISVQATLAPRDLNWINIPVVPPTKETIFAPSSLPSLIGSKITTVTSAVSQATAIQEPKTENMGTPLSIIPRALHHISASIVFISLGCILLLAFSDWQMPPFPFL